MPYMQALPPHLSGCGPAEQLPVIDGIPPERLLEIRRRLHHMKPDDFVRFVATAARDGSRRCLGSRPDARDTPYQAALGTDGLWHVVGRATRKPVCDHERVARRAHRARRPVVPPIMMARTGLRLAVTIPRAARCALDPGAWPMPVVHIAADFPGRWPTTTPPRSYVWAVLLRDQDYRCAACRWRGAHLIDHDHDTRLIRGLLCRDCNNYEARCWHPVDCFTGYRAEPPAARYGWLYDRRGRPSAHPQPDRATLE